MARFRICCALPVILFAGCTVTPRSEDWFEGADPSASVRAPKVAPLQADRRARVGDMLRFEVVHYRADGTQRQWWFELELLELPDYADMPAAMAATVTREDAAPTVDGEAGKIGKGFRTWQYSLGGEPQFDVMQASGTVRVRMGELDGEVDECDVPADVLAHVWQRDGATSQYYGTLELLRVILGVDFAHARLLEVIRIPSLFALAKRLGNVEVSMGFPEDEVPVSLQQTPMGVVPAAWVPLTLDANGEPALDCKLLMTWKQWPVLLSAGVLQIEAHHPDDPKRRVSVRLVEAR